LALNKSAESGQKIRDAITSVERAFLMADTFSDFIARERERLHTEREQVFSQQQELESKLAAVNNELRAIDAYEAAKTGKPIATPQARGRAGQRTARRGSRRDSLLALIRQNAAGLSRGEILERMGLKGNKSGEMSVSNALTALTKVGQVNRDGRKYRPAA
jgi:hypothetical protein